MADHNDTTTPSEFLQELGKQLRHDRHQLAVDLLAYRAACVAQKQKIRAAIRDFLDEK